jgi:glycosyltransferase involved in cell wall biosynthesis
MDLLLAGRGRFWQVSHAVTDLKLSLTSAPRVAVVVAARNQADVVGRAIRSLVEQDYAGRLQTFVVDDHSPTGWTGKMWALSQGVQQAAEFAPDYFLFADADIIHAPDSVTCLVARAGGQP